MTSDADCVSDVREVNIAMGLSDKTDNNQVGIGSWDSGKISQLVSAPRCGRYESLGLISGRGDTRL